MASSINASTTGAGGVITTADASGVLNIQTASTTAMSISAAQVVNFANSPTIAGSALPSGAISLISTLTASSSASLEWTGLSLDKYMIIFQNLIPASNAAFNLVIGTGATPTYISSGYWSWGYGGDGSTLLPQVGNNNSYHSLTSITAYNVLSTGYGISGQILFSAFTSSTTANISTQAVFKFSGGQAGETNSSFVVTTAPITAIKLSFASGNIASGKASLYGISS